jgi:general L-amino acid transport system permease protein
MSRAALWARRLALALGLGLLLVLAAPALRWLVWDATWTGQSRAACDPAGACWAMITARAPQILWGFYPSGHGWRVVLALAVLAAGLAPLAVRGRAGLVLLTAPLGAVACLALMGGARLLPSVPSAYWGGLSLNLIIGAVCAIFALPLGVLLALARRSGLPVIRLLATAYIETARAAPLIVVLFAAAVLVPLLVPAPLALDKLARAMIAITLFEGAYMAEAVRGGLMAVPQGQREAAQALGLGPLRTLVHVVLPQALRTAAPALVNSFIGLLKDTSLIYVIGVLDLTGVLRNAVSDFAWQGLEPEAYIFVGLTFWLLCFGLSRASAALERRLQAAPTPIG